METIPDTIRAYARTLRQEASGLRTLADTIQPERTLRYLELHALADAKEATADALETESHALELDLVQLTR